MENRTKLIGTILGVCLFIILISGMTYAIYTWATTEEDESIIGGNSECFRVIYTKGDDIGSDGSIEELEMGSSYTNGKSTTIKIKMDDSCNYTSGIGTIYLNTTEMGDVFKNSNIINYQVLDGNTAIKSGVVKNIGAIPIYENFDVTTTEKSIEIYLWINGKYVTNSNAQDVLTSVYKGNITVRVEGR